MSHLECNRRYYERQNSLIDKYANVLDTKEQTIDQTLIKLQKRVKLLTTISLAINIVIHFLNVNKIYNEFILDYSVYFL
jgi:hypothetical protein